MPKNYDKLTDLDLDIMNLLKKAEADMKKGDMCVFIRAVDSGEGYECNTIYVGTPVVGANVFATIIMEAVEYLGKRKPIEERPLYYALMEGFLRATEEIEEEQKKDNHG